MRTNHLIASAVALAALCAPASAAAYPVSGSWTYENPTEDGAAKSCGTRHMTFDGTMRSDTGSGAPEYKNISVAKSGAGTWRVVDEFFTGMIRGRVNYTLRVIDADHIELRLDAGTSWKLRRCG